MNPKARRSHASRAWLLAALVAVTVLIVPSWSLIAAGFVKGRGAFDQLNYHEQVVRAFAEQLPKPDYTNYLSATTPGYHTLLAVLARTVSDSRQFLQWTGSLFTVVLVLVLAWGIGRSCCEKVSARGTMRGSTASHVVGLTALLLPVVASMSVFYSATWMLPDNAGWLGVLIVWLIALRPRFDVVTVVGGGVALAVLVFVRQIHLWPLAMLLTAAWLGTADDEDHPFDFAGDLRAIFAKIPASLARVALVCVAAAPAIGVLVYFWLLWDKTLTPPVFDERHVGGNTTAPAFVLAIFGAFSVCFVPFFLDGLRLLWVRHTWLLLVALGLGLVIALVPETSRSYFDGRYSGLWEMVEKLPAPMDRSILVVPLTVLGTVLLAAWFVAMGRRDRWIMLAAMVAFIAAQSVSFKLWQRYTEPMVLLWLALAASRVAPPRSGAGEGWRVVGPAVLTLVMAGITVASLVAARPVARRALVAPWETEAPMLPGMVERPQEVPLPRSPDRHEAQDPPDESAPTDR